MRRREFIIGLLSASAFQASAETFGIGTADVQRRNRSMDIAANFAGAACWTRMKLHRGAFIGWRR